MMEVPADETIYRSMQSATGYQTSYDKITDISIYDVIYIQVIGVQKEGGDLVLASTSISNPLFTDSGIQQQMEELENQISTYSSENASLRSEVEALQGQLNTVREEQSKITSGTGSETGASGTGASGTASETQAASGATGAQAAPVEGTPQQ